MQRKRSLQIEDRSKRNSGDLQNKKKLEININDQKDKENSLEIKNDTSGGFSLASGKPVNVSKESLKRAQKFLQIEDNSNKNTGENIGFSLATGKPVEVSKESLRRAQNLLQIDGNSNMNTEESVGFSLASGKPVNVSKESLQRAQNLLQIESNPNMNTEKIVGFSLASGRPVNVSKESLQRAQNLLQIDGNSNVNTEENVGFSFANGKPVNVSRESLQRAQNLLQIECNPNINTEENVGFLFANGKPVNVLNESLQRAQSLLQIDGNSNVNTEENVGFSFASGKPVNVSKESLQRAQNLLQIDANFNTENTEENIGFSFANGKPVNVSRESLQRAQNLLQIEDKPNMNTEESVGFSFASGKPVNVSKESLQRAQNLLQIDSNYSNNDESVGFSFANGRPMPKLSEESLRRAQNLLQVDSSNSDESVGFSFANGKSMPKVSDSAMNRARSLFENDISRSPIRPHIDSAPLSPPMSPKHSLKKLSPSSVALSHATGIPLSLKSPTQEQTIIRNKLLSSPPPKRNAFKPPKQIVSPNNNNNGQPQVKVLPKPQKSNLTKPFFDISKLNDIQRMTLSEFSIFHGRPNHDEEISFLPSDAESYRFPNGNGYADAYVSLIEKGFDPLLLKPKWVQNHYKWIVWKLKNLDISYPQITIPLLTFDNVVKELEYRAQLEILEAKRSCVRLLYERDASPNVYMILMVSNILNDGNLELTDGWYSIPTIIDILLLDLVKENKITIGMKLRICNAQFDGEEATGPLDEDRSTKLILRINSVRHARWDSQLGFQRYALFPVNINSLYANGGLLPFIEVVVQKKYPYFYRESFKDENVPSIIRTQAQQLEYMQKMEQNFSEELLKLRQEWLKELKEEGTDVQNSNKFLQQYLDSNDQGLFLSSINSLEKKQELISLIEKHQFQEEEFLRSKSEEFITENTNEFSTFFTLSITDLCPGIHKDAEITFWRLPLELYDEIKEGNAYRIFQVETSENRNDLLISKNQTKIIKIESQPQYLTMIYRPRKLLEKFSDSYIYYNEMKLPTGTEFDFIGFVLYVDNNIIYMSDGTYIIISIEFRNNINQEKLKLFETFLVHLQNVKFQNIDMSQGVAHFTAFDTTTISKTPKHNIIKEWNSIMKLREVMSFELFINRIQQMIKGINNNSNEHYININNINNEISFITNNSIIASINDFDSINFLYNENGKSVIIFDSPFVTNNWMKKYIESREEFDIGLNIIIPITDGIGKRFIHITPLTIDQFFSTIGTMISNEQSNIIINFFEKYFENDGTELHNIRLNIKNRYMIDETNIQTILRAAMFHCELIYDERSTIEKLKKRKADLIFPFNEGEWKHFEDVLRRALTGIDAAFELYDDGKLGSEYVSIVSNITPVYTNDAIGHFTRLLS